MFSWCYQDRLDIGDYLQKEDSCVITDTSNVSLRVSHKRRGYRTLEIVVSKEGLEDRVFYNIQDYKDYVGMKGFLKVKKDKFSDPINCIFVSAGKSGYDLICDSIFTEGRIERHALGRFSVSKNENSLRFFTSEREVELFNEVLAVETLKEELRKCREFLDDPWKEYREIEKTYNRKLESKKARTEYKIQKATEVIKILEEKLPALTGYVITKNLMEGKGEEDLKTNENEEK